MKTKFPFLSFSGVEKRRSGELGRRHRESVVFAVTLSAQYYRLHWKFCLLRCNLDTTSHLTASIKHAPVLNRGSFPPHVEYGGKAGNEAIL
jgi:hypothetical protein